MSQKFRTLLWYLKQPGAFHLLWRLFLRMTFYRDREQTQRLAAAWGHSQAVELQAALDELFGEGTLQAPDLDTLYPQDISNAGNAVKNSAFHMGGGGHANLLYAVCDGLRARAVVETGVAYGWSSLAILLSITKRNGNLISTDMPYPKMGNDSSVGIAVPERLRSQWLLIRRADAVALKEAFALLPEVDVIHYDSDKSYVGRWISYPILYRHLREGGILVSDDVQDNLAFKHFCEKINRKPIIIAFRSQLVGIVMK